MVLQTGRGSLHPTTLKESLSLGYEVAQKLDNALLNVLKQVNKSSDVGFLN